MGNPARQVLSPPIVPQVLPAPKPLVAQIRVSIGAAAPQKWRIVVPAPEVILVKADYNMKSRHNNTKLTITCIHV